jgi:hypothetical protein
MADKIDQLKVGNTSYDIDLPPDATPSIKSLTVSENITSPKFIDSTAQSGYLLRANGTSIASLALTGDGSVSLEANTTAKTIAIKQVHP